MSPALKKARRPQQQILTDFFLHFYLFPKFILRSYEIIKHLVGEGGKGNREMSKTELLPSLSGEDRYKHIETMVGCTENNLSNP